MYSDYAVMKLNNAVMTRPGTASGNTTRVNAWKRVLPSMRATSSSDGGIVS